MNALQWLLVFGIIGFLIWLWLRKKPTQEAKKKAPHVIGTYEGWMVTWMGLTSLYPEVRGENAMMLVYGRADIYSNGYIESIPDTYRLTYQQEGEIFRRFNPHYDNMLLSMYKQKQGGRPVQFADGTQTYMSQMFGYRSGYLDAPKSIARLPKSVG